jgi:hypothetical protein
MENPKTQLTLVDAVRSKSAQWRARAVETWKKQLDLFNNRHNPKKEKGGKKPREKYEKQPDDTFLLFPFRSEKAVKVETEKEVPEKIKILMEEIEHGIWDSELAPKPRGRRGPGRPPGKRGPGRPPGKKKKAA